MSDISPGLDYHLMVETLSFLLLDKRHRPFLLLQDSSLGGPTSQMGTTWPHSLTVIVENISYEQATCISGYATVFIDKEAVRPCFLFDQFVVEPFSANRVMLFVSEETYSRAAPSHTFDVYVNLEYHGITAQPKYRLQAWITFDPETGRLNEKLTHAQESVNSGDQKVWIQC